MPVQLPVKDEPSVLEIVPTAGASEPSVIDQIPLPLVLLLASPYLAGKKSTDAIKLAHKIFRDDSFTATLDLLGEDSESAEDCESIVNQYRSLMNEIAEAPLPVQGSTKQMTISCKPSMFSVSAPDPRGGSTPSLEDAYQRIKQVVDYAMQRQIRVTLEAEDHRWTDFQLETYFSLIEEGYTNLGTVLQSRLFRTRSDVRRFDERMRVRLVIGIYNEPPEIAHTQKPVMKELLVEHAFELLGRGTYVELATHDTHCLDSFFGKAAIPTKAPSSQFETQYLLGVPRKKVQHALVSGRYFQSWLEQAPAGDRPYIEQLQASGVLVRLYLPYGPDKVAGPYCRRRLKANPNMIGYGIKNLLHIE